MIAETKKESKKNLKRKKIIKFAAILFSQKSYHEVMMEDVAKMASIAKGTVYNYFSSKEELYFSIMKMQMEKLTLLLKDQINDEKNTLGSIYLFVTNLYSFMMENQNFYLIYRRDSLSTDHQLRKELVSLEKDLYAILASIIKKGKSDGFIRNIGEPFAVDIILGAIYGAVSKGIENNYSEEEKDKDQEEVYDFILHALYSGFNNNELLPLKNKTLVITRTVEQSKESADVFRQLGADVIIFPTLDILPPDSWHQFDNIITGKSKIDFIIFTSAYAVKMFKRRCKELGINVDYNKLNIVAVGNKTASVCEKNKIPVHIIPKKFSGQGVVDALSEQDLNGKVIFIPRSAIGREELPDGLKELGAKIKTAPVYNVSIPSEEKIKMYAAKLDQSNPDAFIFTSPSTFENFLQILNIQNPVKYFNGLDVAAIGPTTMSAIENKGVKVSIMPEEYTIDGLSKAMVDYYK
jgi:uroporphyrinogen-III synthase/AcrR family transcriptional regulator